MFPLFFHSFHHVFFIFVLLSFHHFYIILPAVALILPPFFQQFPSFSILPQFSSFFPPNLLPPPRPPFRGRRKRKGPGDAAALAELHLPTAVGPEPGAAAQQGGLADAALADDQQGLTWGSRHGGDPLKMIG